MHGNFLITLMTRVHLMDKIHGSTIEKPGLPTACGPYPMSIQLDDGRYDVPSVFLKVNISYQDISQTFSNAVLTVASIVYKQARLNLNIMKLHLLTGRQ